MRQQERCKDAERSGCWPIWMVAVNNPDYGTCGFEAKTAAAYKAGEWEDAIPDEYQLQIQHYMAVTGYQGFYIAVLIGGNTFKWKFVELNEELIAMLLELETDVWAHVQDGTPPLLDGSNAAARFLAKRFPSSVPTSQIALPDTAAELIRQYDEACEGLDALTGRKQKAENLLKQMLGEHETETASGRIITWKSITQELIGIIPDYTTPRAYWDTHDPVEGTPPVCMSQNSIISQERKTCMRSGICPSHWMT